MTSQELAKYLAGCGATDLVPVQIQIGKQSYNTACRYTMTYRRARHVRTMIYVLGDLPGAYKRSSRTVFTLTRVMAAVAGGGCEANEWFVAAHSPATEPVKHFLLSPWDHEAPIDYYERTPYKRVSMSVRKAT